MESEYIAAYVSNLSCIQESIKSENRIKLTKVYDEPTFENIKEQSEYAYHNGYKNFGVYIENLKDTEGMKQDLKEALGIDVNVYSSLKEAEEVHTSGPSINNGQNIQTRAVYIVDPFSPMLFFSRDGNNYSKSMIGYCQDVVAWVTAHMAEFDHFYFIGCHLQKGGNQLPEGTWREINASFIENMKHSNGSYAGADTILQFLRLRVPNGIEIPNGVNSVDTLRKALNSGSTIVAPKDYSDIQSLTEEKSKYKAKICNYSFNYINADPSARIMYLIDEYNHDISAHGESTDDKVKTPRLLDYYLKYIIGHRNTPTVKGSIKAAKTGAGALYDLGKDSTIGFGDKYYKHTRSDRVSGSIDYWSDSGLFGFAKQYNNPNKDTNLDKSNDNIKFLLNQKGKDGKRQVDASVEKIYNLKHLPKDMLGIRDDDERYDASKWDSDQYHMEFKGVAGKELFDIQREINRNIDEMVDIQNEINEMNEDDPDYDDTLQKLTHRLDTLEAKNDELRSKISDEKANELSSERIKKSKTGRAEKEKTVQEIKASLNTIRNTKSYKTIETYFCIG